MNVRMFFPSDVFNFHIILISLQYFMRSSYNKRFIELSFFRLVFLIVILGKKIKC